MNIGAKRQNDKNEETTKRFLRSKTFQQEAIHIHIDLGWTIGEHRVWATCKLVFFLLAANMLIFIVRHSYIRVDRKKHCNPQRQFGWLATHKRHRATPNDGMAESITFALLIMAI